MTVRTEQLHFVRCDGCGVEHHDPDSRSALEARIKAGSAGWHFRQGKPGRHGKGRVVQRDGCPNCGLGSQACGSEIEVTP